MFWIILSTSDHTQNLLLLLILYHIQETNFITQLILEIKLTHYLSPLCACPGMHYHTHLKQPTNVFWFHGSLVTFRILTSYLNLFVRYSSLKNSALWLALRFSDHNSRTRFLSNMLFLQKVRRPLTLVWSKKVYIHEDIRLLLKL